MEREKFGWTAPPQPAKKTIGEVPFVLKDLVKVDDDNDSNQVADPVRELVEKWQEPKGEATAVEPFDIRKAILADADVRDKEPSNIILHKNALPDWSWSAPIGDTLGKRATPARARLNLLLDRIFSEHEDFRTEAADIVAEALADERIAIFSET